MKKFLVSIILVISLLVGTIPSFAETVPYGEELKSVPTDTPTITFSDVDNTHWAAKFITEMVNKKILSGYPDGKFRPDRIITRAEFSKIIVSASGLEPKKSNTSTFSDIKTTDWFSPFVETAKDYLTGYKVGNSYVYKPNDPALREDICIAIVKLKGYDSSLADLSIIQAMFTDYDSISESARDYVSIAVENKLISGFPDETFRAQKSLTRAEACTILWKAFMYGNNNKVVAPVVTTTPTTLTTTSRPTPADGDTGNDPTPTPSITDTKSPTKMTVDTLFETTNVWSMVVDRNNDIYVLENTEKYTGPGNAGNASVGSTPYNENTNYMNQKLRKYTNSTGSTNIILTPNKDLTASLSLTRQVDFGGKTQIDTMDYSGYCGYKIIYDSFNDKLFLSGKYSKTNDSDKPAYRSVMYQVIPTIQEAVTDISYTYLWDNDKHTSFNTVCASEDMALVLNDGSIIYEGNSSRVYRVKPQGTVSNYASIPHNATSISEGIMIQGKLYVMSIATDRAGIYEGGSLKSYNVASKTWETIKDYDDSYDAITSYKDEFYISKGNGIYKIGLDGKRTLFVDYQTLILNDFLPVNIDKFMFDSEGNVIFYDSVNSSVRRINLN